MITTNLKVKNLCELYIDFYYIKCNIENINHQVDAFHDQSHLELCLMQIDIPSASSELALLYFVNQFI